MPRYLDALTALFFLMAFLGALAGIGLFLLDVLLALALLMLLSGGPY